MLNRLPTVLCDHILSFCNFDDMMNMHNTSNMWYKLRKTNKNLCDGPTEILKNMPFNKQKLIEKNWYNFVCEENNFGKFNKKFETIFIKNTETVNDKKMRIDCKPLDTLFLGSELTEPATDDENIGMSIFGEDKSTKLATHNDTIYNEVNTETYSDNGIKVDIFSIGEKYKLSNMETDGNYIAIIIKRDKDDDNSDNVNYKTMVEIWSIGKQEKIATIKVGIYASNISIQYPYLAAYTSNYYNRDDHIDSLEYWNIIEKKMIFKNKYGELFKVKISNGLYIYYKVNEDVEKDKEREDKEENEENNEHENKDKKQYTKMIHLDNEGNIIEEINFLLCDRLYNNSFSFLLDIEYKYLYDTNKNEKCLEFKDNNVFIDYCKKNKWIWIWYCPKFCYYKKYNCVVVIDDVYTIIVFDIAQNKVLWSQSYKNLSLCENLNPIIPYVALGHGDYVGQFKPIFLNLFDGTECYEDYKNISVSEIITSGPYIFLQLDYEQCLYIVNINKCYKIKEGSYYQSRDDKWSDLNFGKMIYCQTMKHYLLCMGNGKLICYDSKYGGHIIVYNFGGDS